MAATDRENEETKSSNGQREDYIRNSVVMPAQDPSPGGFAQGCDSKEDERAKRARM
jgi:hypothetical protein